MTMSEIKFLEESNVFWLLSYTVDGMAENTILYKYRISYRTLNLVVKEDLSWK